jgi:hypothetical protein
MPLSTKLRIGLNGKQSGNLSLGGQREANIAKEYALTLADGVLAGQADRVWATTVAALAASSSTDHDLAGALVDPLLGTASFARVKGIIVAAYAANTNTVVVGAAATNPWVGLLGATHTVTLRPGAVFAAMVGPADLAGYAVVAGTGDLLRVANGGAGSSVGYDIAVIGCSA